MRHLFYLHNLPLPDKVAAQWLDSIELNIFAEEEAFQFFTQNIQNHKPNNDPVIRKLLQELSYHPLALQQVVSYINKNGLPVQDFVEIFEQNKKAIHLEEPDQIQRACVYNTLSLSINKVKGIDTVAYDLLTLMTHLDGKEMKKGLFLHVFKMNMIELNSSLSLLRKYSLVNYATDGTSYVPFNEQIVMVHSLTQDYLEFICQEQNHLSSSLTLAANSFLQDLESSKKSFKKLDAKFWLNHFCKIIENKKKSYLFLKEFFNGKGRFLLREMFLVTGTIVEGIKSFEYMNEQEAHFNTIVMLLIMYEDTRNDKKRADLQKEIEKIIKEHRLKYSWNA